MTAAGYRRRQRRKGYPAQSLRVDRWQRSYLRNLYDTTFYGTTGVHEYRVLSPDETTARYPMLRDFRGRAG